MLARLSPWHLTFTLASLLACSRLTEPSSDSSGAKPARPAAVQAPQPTPVVPPPSLAPGRADPPPPPRPPPDNVQQIRASHILIAYKGAFHAPASVTRTKEEAQALAIHVDIEARAGADFEALVLKYSDDPSARNNKGNLGQFTRAQMVKPFADAAFGLMKQEIGVDPIETPFGFHIIKRTE